MSVPIPEKLRCSKGINPVRISQIPSRNVPRFFGSFIGKTLSVKERSADNTVPTSDAPVQIDPRVRPR